jgi:hypothetical protein
MRDWSCQDDLCHVEEDTPTPHLQNGQTYEGWYYLRHVYQSIHTIWYHDTFLTIWMYENRVVPLLRRRVRKSRPVTRGVLLTKITKSMGRRMPISVIKGNRRPHNPFQAAKFASEAGVVVRSQVPIFPHLKHNQGRVQLFYEFMAKLSVSMFILCWHSSLP